MWKIIYYNKLDSSKKFHSAILSEHECLEVIDSNMLVAVNVNKI